MAKETKKNVTTDQEKETYYKAGNALLNSYSDFNKEMEVIFLTSVIQFILLSSPKSPISDSIIPSQLCEYWTSYNDYFTKGSKWVVNVKPIIDEYRARAEELSQALDQVKNERLNSDKNAFKISLETKVFGEALDSICDREESELPRFFEQVCSWIEENGRSSIQLLLV